MHYLQASLKAHGVFRKDIDYVVKDNGEEARRSSSWMRTPAA